MSSAIDPAAGVVYVITHPDFRSLKVGFTTTSSKRVEQFMKHGWQPFQRLLVADARLARKVEQAVLFELRHRLHIAPHLTRAHMTHDAGWTETASAALISANELWNLVCEQAGLEQLAPVLRRAPRQRWGPTPHPRTKGDTPRYARVARIEASRTARAAQVYAPNQSAPRRAAMSRKPDISTEEQK
ncbi:GIY-YIG nuclease family protein [Streptomyces sp. NBC_00441]|uniref:GIY-YIG nuclease family protein n=1 Tax=Streptomyces sp. NBC_00441 TaxID=2975742 RepID=UPI002E2C8585|nr:GIY-YIG nuclease family protein [Streptomyces sp. NBC_00441]